MIHDTINIILLLLLLLLFINNLLKNTSAEKLETGDNKLLNISNKLDDLLKHLYLTKRDEATVYNPLYPPEQRVEERQYPFPNTNWRRTRGEPDDYQLVGLLYNTDVNKNYQLYGRRVYPGSYEWEYYIRGRDAGGLDIKYPIQLNNKQEIMDGMVVNIPIDKNPYTVSIYNYSTPRYNPFPY
jgi:hypothetical protein